MNVLIPILVNEFSCIGSSCPETCCAGWKIVIDEKTDSVYQNTPGEFGDKLKQNIIRDESGAHFQLTSKSRCPFLNDKNLCSIYLTLGPNSLCHTCDTFPRHILQFDDLVLYFLSFACPEAARLFLSSQNKMELSITEQENMQDDPSSLAPEIHNTFVHTLITGFNILQNRSLSLHDRLIVLTVYLYQQQSNLDKNMSDYDTEQLFSNEKAYTNLIFTASIPETNISLRLKLFRLLCSSIFDRAGTDDILTHVYEEFLTYAQNNDPNSVNDNLHIASSNLLTEEMEIELEQLLVYLYFRYTLSDYSSNSLLRPLSNIVAFYSTYLTFLLVETTASGSLPSFEKRILILSHLSRYYEHNRNTFDSVHEIMEQNNITNLESLMQLV